MLSIIIPIYNASSTIERCIDSIRSQLYKDWELILVNDGSTDVSGDYYDHYAKQDSRVHVIHQPNSGQSVARNRGLDVCRGEYVTFVDADDEVGIDAYSANIEILEQHPDIDILQFPTIWNCNTPNAKTDVFADQTIEGRESIFLAWINNMPINNSVWNKIFKKEAIQGLYFKQKRLYEDKLFMLELIDRIQCVQLSSKGSYHYYQYPGSSINNPTPLRCVSWIESEYSVLQKMYEFTSTKSVWLTKWMATNRYLANTQLMYQDLDLSVQMQTMKKSRPSHCLRINKDCFWYCVIRFFGEAFFVRTYITLRKINRNKIIHIL